MKQRGSVLTRSSQPTPAALREEPSFAHRIGYISLLFRRVFRKRLDKVGITDGEWRCLRALWDADGISQRELSNKLDMTTAAAVFWVNVLERDGLARRDEDPNDKRKFSVRLTVKGKRMRDTLRPEIVSVHLRAFDGFSQDELKLFGRMLERVELSLEGLQSEELAAS